MQFKGFSFEHKDIFFKHSLIMIKMYYYYITVCILYKNVTVTMQQGSQKHWLGTK